MNAKIVIALVEAVALVIGLICWHFGIVAWYIVPLFLLIPPVALIVLAILFVGNASRNGGNPFQ
jgi:hypothetical protein